MMLMKPVLLLIALLVFSGCSQIGVSLTKLYDPLAGSWRTNVLGFENVLTFDPNSKIMYLTNFGGTNMFYYEIENDKLILKRITSGTVQFQWDFKVIDNYKALLIDKFLYLPDN